MKALTGGQLSVDLAGIPISDIDHNAIYERLAAAFRRETGILAPGKDQAAAEGETHSREERMRRWREWLAKRDAEKEPPPRLGASEGAGRDD